MAAANAVNATSTGIQTFTGTAFTGSTVTQYGVLVGGASNAVGSIAVGNAGQILQSSGAGVNPAYSTATYPLTTTVSQLLYSSATNTIGGLATANNGTLVTSATGVPSVLAGPGTTGNILQSNAAAAPSFSTAAYPSAATGTGTVLRANGTNWVATTATYPATTTAFQILCSTASNTIGELTAGTTGTVCIGNTGAIPSFSATPSVTSITFGAGTALSSYVEGTFTPTVVGTVAGTTTYTSQNGYYTRIGNIVYVQGRIVITGATGTGTAIFGALPFTIKNQTNGGSTGAFVCASAAWAWPALTTMLAINGAINGTTFTVDALGSLATGALQMTNGAATFRYSMIYQI